VRFSNFSVPALALAVSLLATPVLAQSTPAPESKKSGISTYVGGGYSLYNGGDDLRFGGVVARGGVMFTPNFGAELEFTKGVGDTNLSSLGFSNFTLGLDTQISGFAVGRLPMSEQSNLFGRLGYSSATLSVKGTGPFVGGASDIELKDVIWGIGGEYYFNNNLGVRGEVTGFKAEGDNIDSGLDIFTISLVAKF
jgi:outer membrane immunogenic protein